MKKTILMTLALTISFSANAELLTLDSRIINPNAGMSVAPRFDGKGQQVIVDSTKWDFYTTGNNEQVFTNKRWKSKVIVEFDKQNRVKSVADISELEIEYENQNKRVKCRFDSGESYNKQSCEVYTTKNCSYINGSFQREFQGDFKKLRQCTDKLYNLSLSATNETEKLSNQEKQEILKYKKIADNPKFLRGMQIDNVVVQNKPYSSKTDTGYYGSDISRSGTAIFETLKLCEDRGQLGPDKPPFAKKEATQERKGSAVIAK
jgi:hypothetical protein